MIRLRTIRPMADWPGALTVALVLAATLVLMVLIWLLAHPLALLLVAIILGEALAPAVAWLARRLPRVLAVALVYVVLLLLLGAIVWLVAATLASRVAAGLTRVPALIDHVQTIVEAWDPTIGRHIGDVRGAWAFGAAEGIAEVPLEIAAGIAQALLVVFMSVYWSLGAPALRRFVLSMLPPERGERVAVIATEVGRVAGGYLRARSIDGLLVGIIVWAGLTVLGVDHAPLLAVIAGLGQLVPYLGPIAAAVPAAAIALLASPTQALIVLAFYALVQQIEGAILMPAIVRHRARIPPLVVIFAILAGGWLLGIVGALIAAPVAGALVVLTVQVLAPAVRRWSGAQATPDVARPATSEGGAADHSEPRQAARLGRRLGEMAAEGLDSGHASPGVTAVERPGRPT